MKKFNWIIQIFVIFESFAFYKFEVIDCSMLSPPNNTNLCFCIVQNKEIFNKGQITIDGYRKLNQNVNCSSSREGFAVTYASNFEFFPKNIEKHFKNIVAIYIISSGLKEIHQNDLKVFPYLETLIFNETEIEYLEADLFEFNLLLESFAILKSPLKHIGPKIFDNLKNLKFLVIDKCQNMSLISDKKMTVKEIVEKIQKGFCIVQEFIEKTTTVMTLGDGEI
ncbi:hypothetical protein PVAND_015853 [Polypedilum vanderplanki]|uniref:Receptor L-domain domain-containing protein n=1 Tax=Polypedilum vanderplanki TaxID=319348 RepID=A0A9J6BE43_POLVA|nr:hypothetical protein PVAND_015853 [Polypedilum vanderplanki]